jgi:hypothetical protein
MNDWGEEEEEWRTVPYSSLQMFFRERARERERERE